MELVGILRVLRRRRVLVGLGALMAVAAGAFAIYRVSIAPPGLQSRETASGLARARVLVDTPRSLVAAARAPGDDTIATRAVLLGNLIASDEVRAGIARQAALEASELAVVGPYSSAPAVATPLSREAVEVARPSEPNVVTVSVEDPQVPIVSILVKASDPDTAARLAETATAAFESLVRQREPVGNGGVSIEQLGPVKVGRVINGPGRAVAVIAAVVIFGLWCLAVVLFDGIIRRRSSAAAPAIGLRAPPPSPPQPAALASAQNGNGAGRNHAGLPGS